MSKVLMKYHSRFSTTEQTPVCILALVKTCSEMIAAGTGGEITLFQLPSNKPRIVGIHHIPSPSLPPRASLALFSKIAASQPAQLSQQCMPLFFFHT